MSAQTWSNFVKEQKIKKSQKIPEGWDARDKIAKELGCTPARVSTVLRPGLQSGEVEFKNIFVYDPRKKLTVRMTIYRRVTPAKPKLKKSARRR